MCGHGEVVSGYAYHAMRGIDFVLMSVLCVKSASMCRDTLFLLWNLRERPNNVNPFRRFKRRPRRQNYHGRDRRIQSEASGRMGALLL
jgi:hypothetical protein